MTFGLAAGGVTIGYYLLFYFSNVRLMLHPGVQWASMIFPLANMFWAAGLERRRQSGEFTWQHVLQTAFPVYVWWALFYYLFFYVLYNADASLGQIQHEMTMENLDRYRNWFGEANTRQMEQAFKAEDYQMTIGKTIFGFARSLMGGFGLSLIVALLMKKD